MPLTGECWVGLVQFACQLVVYVGECWVGLVQFAGQLVVHVYRSPVVQGRDICQPPEEPPALQLVGGLLVQLSRSVTGEEGVCTSSEKVGRDTLSVFLCINRCTVPEQFTLKYSLHHFLIDCNMQAMCDSCQYTSCYTYMQVILLQEKHSLLL